MRPGRKYNPKTKQRDEGLGVTQRLPGNRRVAILAGCSVMKHLWHLWLLTWLFAPLGFVGLYASKYGHDRLIEWLLFMPKLDLRL